MCSIICGVSFGIHVCLSPLHKSPPLDAVPFPSIEGLRLSRIILLTQSDQLQQVTHFIKTFYIAALNCLCSPDYIRLSTVLYCRPLSSLICGYNSLIDTTVFMAFREDIPIPQGRGLQRRVNNEISDETGHLEDPHLDLDARTMLVLVKRQQLSVRPKLQRITGVDTY